MLDALELIAPWGAVHLFLSPAHFRVARIGSFTVYYA
jgi:hypothetical protein